ncbi:MAG: hypothetical protein U0800_07640 [Isosphaeraceae bacterium]
MPTPIRYFNLFTPRPGTPFAAGSRLAISGIAGLYDPGQIVFLGPHSYLVQLTDPRGNPRFRDDTAAPVNLVVQGTMRWFATWTALPSVPAGNGPQPYKAELWAWYGAPRPSPFDAHTSVEFAAYSPEATAPSWSLPTGQNPLRLAIDTPLVDEEDPAGFDILLTGSARDFKLEYYLDVVVLNKETNLVVDNLVIPALYNTGDGYQFRARLRPVASGPAGALIPHDVAVMAVDKYTGAVRSATRRKIQVRNPS